MRTEIFNRQTNHRKKFQKRAQRQPMQLLHKRKSLRMLNQKISSANEHNRLYQFAQTINPLTKLTTLILWI